MVCDVSGGSSSAVAIGLQTPKALARILQLSSLLGCPDPIPIVALLCEITIAFDFTNLHTLNVNKRFFRVSLEGLTLETTLKSLLLKILVSEDCERKLFIIDVFCSKLSSFNELESINLKFFFLFNIFKAPVSKPLATTTS